MSKPNGTMKNKPVSRQLSARQLEVMELNETKRIKKGTRQIERKFKGAMFAALSE